MAAVKYAPPAIPPRKKYQTISRCQSGLLSIAGPLPASLAERHDRGHAYQERGAHRQHRVHQDIALRQQGLLGLRGQLVAEAELDRLGGTGLGAGRPEPIVDAVVAEGALVGAPGVVVEGHHPERARADAVPAAVADVLVDVDGAVLGPVDRPGGAGLEASRLRAVLADVRHQQPLQLAVGLRLLDEAHEAVGLVGEVGVVLVAAGPLGLLHRQLVPLLARHLAGPTTDAEGRVREHRERAGHGYTSPFFTLQRKALVS